MTREIDLNLPSRSALSAAAARAAHLLVDRPPFIFEDTLAMALLDDQAEEMIAFHRSHGSHLVLAGTRLVVAARSRYTEDRLADAIARGVGQYVILGAGLDSFAHRSPLAPHVRIFEVDHPATQEWKRQALASVGKTTPDNVTFVPVDFRADVLPDCLARAGFATSRAAFVSWLGVTVYLTRENIAATVNVLGSFAPGTELVADFTLPAGLRDAAGEAYAGFAMPVAAKNGEPWLSLLSPLEAAALLKECGFHVIEQLSQRDWIDRALWDRADALKPSELWMLTRAAVA